MKSRFASGLALVGVLSVGALPRAAQEPDLPTRVKQLEDKVLTLSSALAAIETTQSDAANAAQTFFVAQAKAAKALEDALKTSEDNGFTAGINPRSREVLLAGWRSYLDSLEGALPSSAKRSSETADAPPKTLK